MKPIKAWIYQWPDDKRLQDGKVVFKRVSRENVKALKLKETAVVMNVLHS